MCGALAHHCAARGLSLDALALHDPRERHAASIAGDAYTSQGFAGDKVAFVLAALRRARGARAVFVNHPDLAPVAALVGRPFSVAVHGFDGWRVLSWSKRAALRRARRVISSSEHTWRETKVSQRLDPTAGRTVHPGVEPDVLETVAPSRQRAPGPLRVLAVSRLVRSDAYKGVDVLIEAVARLPSSVCNLTIVGEGDDRSRLEALANSRGVASRVRFAGRVDDTGLSREYGTSDVFALPSLEEGFGIAYIEAATHGIPAVALCAAGASEAVLDGKTGLLAREQDPGEIAALLAELAADETLRQRLGNAARERALRDYGYESYRTRFLAAMEGAL